MAKSRKRKTHRVKGHYRNGKWIAPHERRMPCNH